MDNQVPESASGGENELSGEPSHQKRLPTTGHILATITMIFKNLVFTDRL
jgi:hypothetical protein